MGWGGVLLYRVAVPSVGRHLAVSLGRNPRLRRKHVVVRSCGTAASGGARRYSSMMIQQQSGSNIPDQWTLRDRTRVLGNATSPTCRLTGSVEPRDHICKAILEEESVCLNRN